LLGEMPRKDKGEMPTPEEIAAEEAAAKAAADAAAASGDDESKAELERVKKALREANRESAERRKRLEELESAETARQQAAMTEAERLKAEKIQAEKERDEERAARKRDRIETAFVIEAAKQGAKYPEDVYRLADTAGVVVGDDGKITGVAEAVKSLVDAGRIPLGKVPAPSLDGGAGGNGDHSKDVKLTAEEIASAKKLGLTPEAYAKSKAARKPAET
jgi:hypothetical protein